MLQATVQLYKNAYGGLSRPIWWLSLVMLVNRSGTMVIPFLTVYLTTKGYTLAQAGFVMATFGAGSIVGSYMGGRFTDKFGFYYVQVFSLLLNGFLFFVLGAMQTLEQMAVCIFLVSSLGEAFRPANAAAIAAYSNEHNRTRCYSLNRLAINLGWAIGPAVGGLLASIDYKWLFWVDGSTCIAAAFLLYIFLPPKKNKIAAAANTYAATGISSAYKDKVFLQAMFLILLISICFFQLFSLVPVFYKEKIGLQESTIGIVLSLNGILIALVEMILVYKLEHKRKGVAYMALGAFLIALSFLILNIYPSLAIVLLSTIVVTFGEMFLFPFINTFWVARSTPYNRGQYAALYGIAFSISQVLAPTLAAQVATVLGFNTLWSINFFICTLAALGFIFLQKQITIHGSV